MFLEVVYVLVFDLLKYLFDKVGGNGGDNFFLFNFDREDLNLDYIMRWMDIVYFLKYFVYSEILFLVIFVGMYVDSVKEDFDRIMDCLLDRFCKNRLLGEYIVGRVVVDNICVGKVFGQEDLGIVYLYWQIL